MIIGLICRILLGINNIHWAVRTGSAKHGTLMPKKYEFPDK